MRNIDSSQLLEFGDDIDSNDRDLSIFNTAARSFMMKSGCLLSQRYTGCRDIEILGKALDDYCTLQVADRLDYFVDHISFL